MTSEYRVVTLIAIDLNETLLGSTSFCLTTREATNKFSEIFRWSSSGATKEDFIGFCQTNFKEIKPLNKVKFPISIRNYLQGSFTCANVCEYLDARIEAGF